MGSQMNEVANLDEIQVATLEDSVSKSLSEKLSGAGNPATDVDRAMATYRKIFAVLPTDVLLKLLDFGRHPEAPGVMLVRNLPRDVSLPPTPIDGYPSELKGTFVAEGALLGVSSLLGEPVGYLTEKRGQLIHDVVPAREGESSQTNRGSAVFLNFHNDIVYNEKGLFAQANPDFLVLSCLRPDGEAQALTYYAEAKDIIAALDRKTLSILRRSIFRLNAPGSYVQDNCPGQEVLSKRLAIISGPDRSPEISLSANGVRAETDAGVSAIEELQDACRSVASGMALQAGDALLINNRKGLHARSRFVARYDGHDRWLQRTYVRRELWTIRQFLSSVDRRVYK